VEVNMNDTDKILIVVFLLVVIAIVAFSLGSFGAAPVSPGVSGAAVASQAPPPQSFSQGFVGGGCGI
jgi:hypothetical protein